MQKRQTDLLGPLLMLQDVCTAFDNWNLLHIFMANMFYASWKNIVILSQLFLFVCFMNDLTLMIAVMCVFSQDGHIRTLSVGTPIETSLTERRPKGKPCRHLILISWRPFRRSKVFFSGQWTVRFVLHNVGFVDAMMSFSFNKHRCESEQCVWAKNVP